MKAWIGGKMNTSVKKCCICNNKKIGEFILINNEKYHLCCIEQLSQENKELKSQLRGTTHCYDEEEHRRLVEENKQLINNWNKLKEYARENLYFYSGYQNEDLEIDSTLQGILSTMQELEQGSGSDE